VSYATLLEEWTALLERRPSFREPLAPYGELLEAWAGWPQVGAPTLRWDLDQCRDRWQRGVPLLAEAPPSIDPEDIEDLVARVMEVLLATREEQDAVQRFAEAWDLGRVRPGDLLPRKGRIGAASVQEDVGLSHEVLGLLAQGSLRPILEAYLGECRPHLAESPWDLGICPFCGGPPGFGDILEDGRRRLACHLCGGGWIFSRLRCPCCGSRNAQDLVCFQAEDVEEGYLISACKACNGYLKELDRRLRWNAGSALVEDWGSPHLDLIAQREGYWRAVPLLIPLEAPG
jgi:FdhE protein